MNRDGVRVFAAAVIFGLVAAAADEPGSAAVPASPTAPPATVPAPDAPKSDAAVPAVVTPATPAPAPEPAPAAKGADEKGGKKNGKDKLAQFDLNGDGVVDDDELQKASEQQAATLRKQLEQVVAKCDANKDGVLSEEETAKLKELLAKNRQLAEHVAKFDTDKNYKLDGPECLAASQFFKAQIEKKVHAKTGGRPKGASSMPPGASRLPAAGNAPPPPVRP